MTRRSFIASIGIAAIAWPLATFAQQTAMPRIGVLMGVAEHDPESERWMRALLEGLSELGWKRDKNLRIDIRWAGADPARMRQLAKELIDLQPDLIHATTTPATSTVLHQTHTIPVVFSIVSDPLGSGFVESFARPGRNATGFVNLETHWQENGSNCSSCSRRKFLGFASPSIRKLHRNRPITSNY